MYRKSTFVIGAVAAPLLALGCIPSQSARGSRWEMPAVTEPERSPETASQREEPKGSAVGEDAAKKTPSDEPRSRERGRTVRHLPVMCDTVAYANVKALEVLAPVAVNEAGIRDAVKALLEAHKDVGTAMRQGLEAMHAEGLYWRRDLEEASACFDKDQMKVLVVSGGFAASDLIRALRSWATQAGGSAAVVDRAGHSYAMVGHYYAAEVAPGMVAIAQEMDAIDAAHADGPGIVARGGEEDALVLVRTRRSGSREITSSLAPIGEDALVVNTRIEREGALDAGRDRGPLREQIDRITEALRDSPLSPIADDVGRTDIVFVGHSARLRTVLAEADVREGIAKASSSGADAWGGLRERWMPAAGAPRPEETQPAPIKISSPPPADDPPPEHHETKEAPEHPEAPPAEPEPGAKP